MRFALIAIASCSLLMNVASAQAPECTRSILPVGVVDEELSYVGTLSREHFRVEINHQPVTLENVTASVPQNIVLLLDSSPTMHTSVQKRRYELELAYFLISAAPASSAVSMFVYGARVDALLQDRQPILNELKARLEGNDPSSGDSALVPTAAKVVANMNAPEPGDVIFVLTSGDFSLSSKRSQEDLVAGMQHSGIRLFYVFLDDSMFRGARLGSTTDTRLHRDILLGSMPQKTGGFTMGIPIHGGTGKQSAAHFKDALVSLMYRFYRLEIQASKPFSAEETVSVTLTDAGKKLGKKPFPFFPARIRACGEKMK